MTPRGVTRRLRRPRLALLLVDVHRYERGVTCRELAAELGCAPSTVSRALRRLGVAMRTRGRRRTGARALETARVVYEHTRSLRGTAAILGVSEKTIRRRLAAAVEVAAEGR